MIRHPEELFDTLSAITNDRSYRDVKKLLRGKQEMEGLTMYSILEEIKSQEIKKGFEQGIESGIEQGIKALVNVCRSMNVSKAVTADNLKEQFSLSSEDAMAYVDQYWN